ncbi:hypothetical protein LSTR_LSTR000597 [Laodelphax striatellus]|uniref:CDK-activating kinase assembly factor MAT1 n=1 Tax=Laodelphax striatellus TaxID=195883 RepID=A0A482XF30_LAOST|nr:hypothetical protein LSTR_LSTR000597 [Laodelphax striatellus]
MDDQACPRCKTTKYRNPSLKLMVNVCGHALCESCVDLLFLKGSGSCPECDVPLRRSNFRVQLFEDPAVEKEVDIRKRVLKDFNKKEEDFSSLNEYNDYLENVETIIFNLTNNIDVMETNKRIEQYKRDNRELILKNKIKIGREELELEELLEEEKHIDQIRKKEIVKEELELKRKKIKEKEDLIDELMFSNQDAKKIVNEFAQISQAAAKEMESSKPTAPPRASQFSTGIKFGRTSQQSAYHIPIIEDGPLYTYKEPEIVVDGPEPPVWSEIETGRYIVHMRPETVEERAGGYTANIACMRALQEAFMGLYHVSRPEQGQSS